MQPGRWIGIVAAAQIAKRSTTRLRQCDDVLQPARDVGGRRLYLRMAVERWAAQLEVQRAERDARKATAAGAR